MMRYHLYFAMFGAIGLLFACGEKVPSPVMASGPATMPVVSAATRPATMPVSYTSYTNDKYGIAFDYPGEWTTKPDKDYVLVVVPPENENAADQLISLDVPDLPMHIPGMIPLGLVKSGYVDDLKTEFGQIKVEQDSPQSVPKAKAQLVRTTYQAKGRAMSQTALLMVHGDRVYIIRFITRAENYEANKGAFEGVVKSLRWTK